MKLAHLWLLIILETIPHWAFSEVVITKKPEQQSTKVKCCGYMGPTTEMRRYTQDTHALLYGIRNNSYSNTRSGTLENRSSNRLVENHSFDALVARRR